ncbi:hypothetical protein [Saccharomonospora cyanea]|uniref:Uncharacterized protein n=1 Tax=Saccharomonospora cyanea NA-134 TaxID=882082 RepID=H5XG91_9PSEU|nr:hypothetical protein [Saccharomonospora cyanea]EHR59410.1 hypothetical protein SaccyDRAFT_0482 [Saccharomonospora cyanea NA-134]
MIFEFIPLLALLVLVILFASSHETLRSAWFRFVRLPALVRENGWLMKRRMPWQSREGGELPGSGSVPWTYAVPYAECEVLGTYAHRPVHGIEFGIPTKSYIGEGKPNRVIDRYSVVTVATSAQPFDDFHGVPGGRPISGNPESFYPDFVDWIRDRMPNSAEPLKDEGPGLVSYSWRGPLSKRRLFRALDELTGTG